MLGREKSQHSAGSGNDCSTTLWGMHYGVASDNELEDVIRGQDEGVAEGQVGTNECGGEVEDEEWDCQMTDTVTVVADPANPEGDPIKFNEYLVLKSLGAGELGS